MKIIAFIDVDEVKLAQTGHSFKEAMEGAMPDGISLTNYKFAEKCSTYEYAAFAWNKEEQEYSQIGRAVGTEQLCRNRFNERIERSLLGPCYDNKNVIFKRRSISELYGDWEKLE